MKSLRERVTVTAMCGENRVLTSQMRADADGDRFLSDVCMTRPVDQPALMRLRKPLLAEANDLHLAIEREEVGVGEWGGRQGVGSQYASCHTRPGGSWNPAYSMCRTRRCDGFAERFEA